MSARLRSEIREFAATTKWTFAKTYVATWPHEYIVRQSVDERLFVELVQHIRTHGYDAHFYSKRTRYFAEDGMVYWTMGAPIDETTIVNRCAEAQTYEYRLRNGTLPQSKGEITPVHTTVPRKTSSSPS